MAGKRNGNLSVKASRIYRAIRREHPGDSKSKAARIANAQVAGTVNHHRRRSK